MKQYLIIACFALAAAAGAAQNTTKVVMQETDTASAPAPMGQILDFYPVVITTKLRECQQFYTRWLGMQTAFESSWFVYLVMPGERPFSFALMSDEHPSSPPSPRPSTGQGGFLTIELADVRTTYEQLKTAGLPIAYALRDEPWGQRRFGLIDPNGIWIDLVQQIEPEAGFWEPYLGKH